MYIAYCIQHSLCPKESAKSGLFKVLKVLLRVLKVLKGLPKCILQRRRNLCIVTGIIVTGIVNNKQTNEFILYFNKQTNKQTNKRVHFIFHV